MHQVYSLWAAGLKVSYMWKVKIFLHVHIMKACRGNRDRAPFLTLALNGSEWFTSCPGYFTLGKNVGTH